MTQADPIDDNLDVATIKAQTVIVESAFREVGPIIVRQAGQAQGTRTKADGSPVTDTDIAVEQAIVRSIKTQSDISVYGEESGYADDLAGTYWLIDPIDGTGDFVKGVPRFTTMGVLIANNQAVSSIIYNPSTDDMYVAIAGQGATKNGLTIDLRRTKLPHAALCKRYFIDELNAMMAPQHVSCEQAPSGGGYGFMMVADGLAAARFNMHSHGYIHDYAPGALLVAEAGGVNIPILEDTYSFASRSFVACHPVLESVLTVNRSTLRQLENS